MKKRIENLSKSISLMQPTRPVFCTTKNKDGSDHVAPFSWIMPISYTPPRAVFALQNQRGKKMSQTLTNIMREREFVINMPHAGQEETLIESSFEQDEGISKFDRTGYTRVDSRMVKPKQIAECSASIECEVQDVIDFGGDHTLILAGIVSAAYDDELYDESLYPIIPDMVPLINLKAFRFDDHEKHLFIDAGKVYSKTVYKDKKEK